MSVWVVQLTCWDENGESERVARNVSRARRHFFCSRHLMTPSFFWELMYLLDEIKIGRKIGSPHKQFVEMRMDSSGSASESCTDWNMSGIIALCQG